MSSETGRAGARNRINHRGFTLIEIMVVIVVIAIIAALVAPNVFKNVGQAKVTAARAQMESIATALDSYRLDNGRYPTTEEGLIALWEAPYSGTARNWKGPYLRKKITGDPWGEEYQYTSPGLFNPTGFDLTSLGADSAPGGEGEDADINHWESGG